MGNMIDGLIEKYMDYATVNSHTLNNYINMYGKDALYMVMNIEGNGDRDSTSDNIYIAALGRGNTAFSYSDSVMERYPVKILVDYDNWYKGYIGDNIDIVLYFTGVSYPVLHKGDVVMHESRGSTHFYRVVDYMDAYNSCLYRVTMRLIQSKDSGRDKYINNKDKDIMNRGLVI